MNDIQIQTFTYEAIGELRGVIKDGEPWFLAGNVCNCLGINKASDAVKTIISSYQDIENDIKKGVDSIEPLLKTPKSCYMTINTAGGKQKVLFIDEQMLYELIMQSRKKKARLFKAWVTGTVLPALRKHGEYRMEGKRIRRSMTDAIKHNIVEKSESENEKKFAYVNFTSLINKKLGLAKRNDRDALSADILEKIAHMENLVQILIDEGKSYMEVKNILETLPIGLSSNGNAA